MGCSSCSNGVNGLPRGCKNRGVCSSDSCNNLTVFNWLENMSLPQGKELFPFVEVRFKNSRKEFYNFYENIPIQLGMLVVIKLENGYDIGTITLKGELVKIQMKLKKTSSLEKSIGKIVRVANEKEIEIWKKARSKEAEVQKKARELAIKLKLEMKLSDVEFQGDGKKATFYYTSENRVDFRQLIKDMARVFSIRIEMRQIGLRQEASRLGGIGSCGRELCCSSWLTR
jgi:cell fate regulator YaaT (PSP1 superfamily)